MSLDRGTYHIALTKRGYGIKYLYDVVIQGESLSLNQLFDMPALTLLPEVIIGGVVETGTFVYDESRNLVVSGNTTFDAGTSIVFNPGDTDRFMIYNYRDDETCRFCKCGRFPLCSILQSYKLIQPNNSYSFQSLSIDPDLL